MAWQLLIFMNHHHHRIKQHKYLRIILLVCLRRDFPFETLCPSIVDTNMFVSSAQAPFDGVYQRQQTGLPRPEFIPQAAYQNNAFGGQMYVPQMNGQQVCLIFSSFHSLSMVFDLTEPNAAIL